MSLVRGEISPLTSVKGMTDFTHPSPVMRRYRFHLEQLMTCLYTNPKLTKFISQ